MQRAILTILHAGILQCRVAAAAGDVQRCFEVSDLLHNLPQMLLDYRRESLEYFLEVEAASPFAKTFVSPSDWELLQSYVQPGR
ncbi:MAG: hypothetical protein AAGF12_40480 [Myxococcota bacterium]